MSELKIRFEPRDIWVGIYWNLDSQSKAHTVICIFTICIIPMLPSGMRFEWGSK